jgi:sec-independent protein translocase protein TatA
VVAIFDPFSPDMLVILAVLVLLFGAKRLPEIARSLGRSSSEFKKGLREGGVESEETRGGGNRAASEGTGDSGQAG